MSKSPESTKVQSKTRKPVGRPRVDGKPHLTRERVFDVCSKLFAEHGFAGTGIRIIANALDASPASLFNLFGSKDELLIELITFAAQPSFDFYDKLKNVDAPAEVKLFKSIYEEVVVVASAERDHAAVFYLPELRKPEFKPAQEIRMRMISHYEELISQSAQEGNTVTSHADLVAEQVFQLTETSILAGSSVKKIHPKKMAAWTASFCLRSLLVDTDSLEGIEKQALALKLKIEPPDFRSA